MKSIDFLPYPTMSAGMGPWDAQGRPIREVVLSNWFATQHDVAEMRLNVRAITAISDAGTECEIQDFPTQKLIKIQGIASGGLIRSRRLVGLAPGNYRRLRFYLEPHGGTFIFSDRQEMPILDQYFLDFDFQDGLEIRGNESPEFILRFDFPPFTSRRLNDSFRRLLKRSVRST